MNKGEKTTSTPAPAPEARPAPEYVPPAVAWEEEFDPLASCESNPNDPCCLFPGAEC